MRPSQPAFAPGAQAANLHEIARLCHVSIASVSRALNRQPGVGANTSKRILAMAQEIGYYPSSTARALVTGRSKAFGLLISDIVNPFFAELLREFDEEAISERYEVIITNLNGDSQRIRESARRLLERKVDGVAIMTAEQSPLLNQLRRRKIPVVLLDSGVTSPYVSTIKVEALTGIEQALQHLTSLGHSRIAYLGATVSLAPEKLRLKAFLVAMKRFGLAAPQSLIFEDNHPTIQGGFDGMVKLLRARTMPTAALAFNDAMAIGALHAARQKSVDVPGSLSIIGFDNVEMGAFVQPELTTIGSSRPRLAHLAFGTLVRMSKGASGNAASLPTSLVVRSSTGPASK